MGAGVLILIANTPGILWQILQVGAIPFIGTSCGGFYQRLKTLSLGGVAVIIQAVKFKSALNNPYILSHPSFLSLLHLDE